MPAPMILPLPWPSCKGLKLSNNSLLPVRLFRRGSFGKGLNAPSLLASPKRISGELNAKKTANKQIQGQSISIPTWSMSNIGSIATVMWKIYTAFWNIHCSTDMIAGTVAVTNVYGEMISMLGEGAFFGELAMLATARRTAGCVCISSCDLCVLSGGALNQVMKVSKQSLWCHAGPPAFMTIDTCTMQRSSAHLMHIVGLHCVCYCIV